MSNAYIANEVDSAVVSPGRNVYFGVNFAAEPKSRPSQTENVAVTRIDPDFYNMMHPKRGKAVIFNHITFDNSLEYPEREGSEQDGKQLCEELEKLDFEVKVYTDLTAQDIHSALQILANDPSNEKSDCILIAVFSHGGANHIQAKDVGYKPEILWSPFTADNCARLAGKPKLFIIQACQGSKVDKGVTLKPNYNTDVDSCAVPVLSYKIPNQPDFLIAYSTFSDFYSWRNTTDGSWFIQALCTALKEYAHKEDFLSVLTIASRIVATDHESNAPKDPMMHKKKQIPCLTSLLTGKVMFHKKP